VDPVTVSVFTVPDGSGFPLSECFLFGGQLTDATITLVLRDQFGNPVPNYPAEEMWLATMQDGLVRCSRGSIADHPTDQNGRTTFSGPVFGGGASDPNHEEVCVIVVGGCASYDLGRTILFNSPDLNGDLKVNLCDAVCYTVYKDATSDYAFDFYWDGVINLSDLILFSRALGAACP
jgi:hypothetical protein